MIGNFVMRSAKFRLIIFLPFIGLSLFMTLICKSCLFQKSISVSTTFPNKIFHTNPVTLNSIIVYKAYIEKFENKKLHGEHKNHIRILAFSQCYLNEKSNLSVTTPDGKSYTAIPNPIEGECPWHWAKNCSWNSFIIDSHVGSDSYDHIVFSYEKRNVTIPLVQRDRNSYELVVCVPPLYWYTEWIRFFEFIEIWKFLGATHFYIYYQSVSKLLYSILVEYRKLGLVTLVEWTELPKSNKVDPNESLYRLGHSSAHNDCMLRSNAKFVALVDVDEIIAPSTRNQTLLAYLKNLLKSHPLAGSFRFQHARLRFPVAKLKFKTDLSHLDFCWLLSAEADLKPGPSKVVFMPLRVDVLFTHIVKSYKIPYSDVEVEKQEAMLYHSRSNWKSLDSNGEKYASLPLIKNLYNENLRKEVMKNYNKIIRNIKDPVLLRKSQYSRVPHLLRQCLYNWKNIGCKTPIHSCFSRLTSIEEWVFSNPGNDNRYFIL